MDRKYLKTIVDYRPTIISFESKCNNCPFLFVNTKNRIVQCLKSKKTIQELSSYISYKGKTSPINDISLPYWCELSPSVSKVMKDLITEVDGEEIKQRKDTSKMTIIVSNETIRWAGNQLTLRDVKRKNDNFNDNPIIKYNKICSHCSKEKEDVDRKKNFGMCQDCFNKYKNDEKLTYFSLINNFRLKRNIEISKKDIKILSRKKYEKE